MLKINLERIRKSRNLSKRKLAQLSGVSEAQVTRIEEGQASPNLDTLSKLARALSITVKEIIQETPTQRVLTFAHNKGGVGKTTFSLLTAVSLSEMGFNTVMIDNDPQATATSWFLNRLLDEDEAALEDAYHQINRHNIFELLKGETTLEQCFMVAKGYPNLRFLCSTSAYEEAKALFANTPGNSSIFQVTLGSLTADIVIVDSPGETSLISDWGLSLAHQVIVPVETDMFAVDASHLILKRIKQAQLYLNPQLQRTIILPNKVRNRKNSMHSLDVLSKHFNDYLLHHDGKRIAIGDYVEISNFSAYGTKLPPSSNAGKQFSQFTRSLIEGQMDAPSFHL